MLQQKGENDLPDNRNRSSFVAKEEEPSKREKDHGIASPSLAVGLVQNIRATAAAEEGEEEKEIRQQKGQNDLPEIRNRSSLVAKEESSKREKDRGIASPSRAKALVQNIWETPKALWPALDVVDAGFCPFVDPAEVEERRRKVGRGCGGTVWLARAGGGWNERGRQR